MGKCGLKDVHSFSHQIRHSQENLPVFIAGQECLQEVRLGPEHSEGRIGCIDFRILMREFDIMKVDDHSGGEVMNGTGGHPTLRHSSEPSPVVPFAG